MISNKCVNKELKFKKNKKNPNKLKFNRHQTMAKHKKMIKKSAKDEK